MNKESVSAKMTVTLVVGGNTIELSESDARKVLGELQRMFKVEIKTVERNHNPFQFGPLISSTDYPYTSTIPCETYLVK